MIIDSQESLECVFAENDYLNILANTSIEFNPILNDSVQNINNSFILEILPSELSIGEFTITHSDSIRYTPPLDFSGLSYIDYIVCDSSGNTVNCDTAEIQVTIGFEAIEENITVNPDEELIFDPIDNDIVNPEVVTIEIITDSTTNGTVTITPEDSIIYVPDSGFVGIDTIIYVVCDTVSDPQICDTSQIIIQVLPDVFSATLDNDATKINTTLRVNILENDFILDPSQTTISIIDSTNYGTSTILDNQLVYEPFETYTGLDTLHYKICDATFTVSPLCDSTFVIITVDPEAVRDEFEVLSGQETELNPLLNDTINPAVTILEFVSTNFLNGHGIILNNGNITYTSDSNFIGSDSIMYAICDTSAEVNICDTATIYIEALPPKPIAENDYYLFSDTTLLFDILENDLYLYDSTLSLTLIEGNETNTISIVNQQLSFVPSAGFVGVDMIQYEICNIINDQTLCDTASVELLVGFELFNDSLTSTASIPVTVQPLNNDIINPDFTEISLIDSSENIDINLNNRTQTITLTPNGSFIGREDIEVEICDIGSSPKRCDTSIISIEIQATPPLARNDELEHISNTISDILPTANDIIPRPEETQIYLINTSSNSVVEILDDSILRYSANTSFLGYDTITYSICDEGYNIDLCDTATIVINVVEREIPALKDDNIKTINKGNPISIDILANDDLERAGYVSVELITYSDTNSFSFTDNVLIFETIPTFEGEDSLLYVVCDTTFTPHLCDTAKVNIYTQIDTLYIPEETHLVEVGDTLRIERELPLDLSFEIEDIDPELIVYYDTTANDWVIYPQDDFDGSDTIAVTVCDTTFIPADCESLEVHIWTIYPWVATNDSISLIKNNTANIDITENDNVNPRERITLEILTPSTAGSAILSGNQIIYTPENEFTGLDSLTYVVCDTFLAPGQCDTAKVKINVYDFEEVDLAVNDTLIIKEDSFGLLLLLSNDVTNNGIDSLYYVSELNDTTSDDLNVLLKDGDSLYITPEENWYGQCGFSYALTLDSQIIDYASLTVIVEPVNDPPQLDGPIEKDSLFNTTSKVYTNLLSNNSDIDSDSIYIANARSSAGNATSIQEGNHLNYVITSSFEEDTIFYNVCDNHSPSACIEDTLIIYLFENEKPKPTPGDIEQIIIPEAFSPNGDGMNQFFEIQGTEGFTSIRLKVFNRNGMLVYSNSDYQNDWAGENNISSLISDVPDGGYLYVLEIENSNQETTLIKGSVFIVR